MMMTGKICYRSAVPNKEGNGFRSLNNTEAHKRRNAVFLRAYAVACPLWGAVAGRLRPAGLPLVYRSANPAICRPPRFAVGSGATTHQGGSHA